LIPSAFLFIRVEYSGVRLRNLHYCRPMAVCGAGETGSGKSRELED
jgi:hypothetical protein